MSVRKNSDYFLPSVVILAAGESKRMGKPKGLLVYKGTFFIQHQIKSLKEIGFENIVVVLGKDYSRYVELVPKLKNEIIVRNLQTEKGQFFSIQCGLKKVREFSDDGVFILPIDVSCPNKETWNKILENVDGVSAVIPSYKGRRGHPVFLSPKLIEHILSCTSEHRLDYELKKLEKRNKVRIIDVNDRKVTLNLNTLEEWKKYVNEQ
ncbi:MAG: nucleotidyltransferase family protein [Candidatus Heimdallarchaeum endolithica]|uniref:Nucleotidyltransferase family protein n=1 Tax=Candidatus Heimdallarchaeum endolithica TaxID=2876572 RepID=A0A9Y1BR59_9ARCH|nr:MAG: nucleotidyltransferase family protein [Candidatus Heimdallarchaeum endolithica]